MTSWLGKRYSSLVRVLRKRLSIYVFSSFPFGSEGGIVGLIVIVPDYCLTFNLGTPKAKYRK